MSEVIKVPDIGDFEDVPVIEVLVAAGDTVAAEQSLLTLESDKATLEVPSPRAGKVARVLVEVGDRLSEGSPIVELEAAPAEASAPREDARAPAPAGPSAGGAGDRAAAGERASPAPGPAPGGEGAADLETGLLVLGSGPGGYTAAFRAADLGLDVTLVERYPTLGGVCLNVGCIPSKALLHTAEVITGAAALAEHGVRFGPPEIELERLRGWKDGVVGKLTAGLETMARKRRVRVVRGTGRFEGPHRLAVEHGGERTVIAFEKAIIAAGSRPVRLPQLPWDDPRVMDSTGALELPGIPGRLLVIGGGIIGMEMASVYHALGAKVTVVEMLDQLMPGADADLVKAFHRFVAGRYEQILLGTRVAAVRAAEAGLVVEFEGDGAPEPGPFDRVLVAVGRTPNGAAIGAEAAGVAVNERGFIEVDGQLRTNVDHIHAIGDIVGPPMLAHKATHEGKVAAEVCAGQPAAFDARVIPNVAYTDPEVAWVGLTEGEARAQGREIGIGRFPWAASGRSLGLGRSEGLTKLIFDPDSRRLLGAGIVGSHAGDLIAECALAIEMGAEAEDIGLTIHPHPTLSETVAMAAEAFAGTITDLYLPRRG